MLSSAEQGVLGSKNGVVSVECFVGLSGGLPWHTFDGRIVFSSSGGGLGDARQIGGQLLLPDEVTITRIIIYGTNGAGADVNWVLKEQLLTGGGGTIVGLIPINTWVNVSVEVNTRLNAYHFYVLDLNNTDTDCYVKGAIIEFERRKK